MLYTPNGGVHAPEWADLDRRLREGDGIAWSGDPRLYLSIGTMINRATGAIGRRLEVYRDNEDGSTSLVGHWLPKEQFRVLFDLAQMRVDRPGGADVQDRIDTHNEAQAAAASAKHVEATTELLDYAVRLHVEREHGKHKHFIDTEAPKPSLPKDA
jgi:hypothetical protein